MESLWGLPPPPSCPGLRSPVPYRCDRSRGTALVEEEERERDVAACSSSLALTSDLPRYSDHSTNVFSSEIRTSRIIWCCEVSEVSRENSICQGEKEKERERKKSDDVPEGVVDVSCVSVLSSSLSHSRSQRYSPSRSQASAFVESYRRKHFEEEDSSITKIYYGMQCKLYS